MSGFSMADIGTRMVEQSNRSTQYVMFAIQVDVSVYVNEHSDWEFKERSEYNDDYCKNCYALMDEGKDLPDDCDDCPSEQFNYFNVEEKLTVESVGLFFTEDACQKHIDENKHHYRNPQIYGVAAWRNPEMVAVMHHLIESAGKDIPSHYA